MTARKLDFSMSLNSELVPVKVRVFDTDNGVVSHFGGGIFKGTQLNYKDVKALIDMLEQVQGHMGDIANGATP